ncbi:phosphatidate cytidylyltransferase [Methylobacterium organophilum]|nr:phosphatidate cytidylyltransferase [Methylobacterium organophilum]UMY19700.1 phosphatidate cytidylyltransferase [Methylobacterium organophilum]
MSGRGSAPTPAGARRMPFATREFALRAVSGVVLAALVLAALLVGGWPFAAIWLAAGILGAGEWLAMSRTAPTRLLGIVSAAGLIGLCVALLARLPLPVAAAIAALAVAILAVAARGATGRLHAVLGFAAASVVVLVPTALREDPAIGLVGPAWIFAVVWSTDIAAYFAGRLLGGPKLMPRVSPNKTWSGAVGGLLAGTLAGLGVVLAAREGSPDLFGRLPLLAVALVSALASVLSQGGDLFESALKRRYGVKDSGHTIPGHGGIMDRLDGFFAVALLAGLALLARRLAAV